MPAKMRTSGPDCQCEDVPDPVTCEIYSTDFTADPFAAGDLVAVSGTFTHGSGEVTTTSATPRAQTVDESTTGHGVASVDGKSSATGNSISVVGSDNGSTYVRATLFINGSSSTFGIFDSAGSQIGHLVTLSASVDTYYTLKICWNGTRVNAILSLTSSGDCRAHVPGTYTGTGTKAGFSGARPSTGTLTYDNFVFSHGPGDVLNEGTDDEVTCDDCTSGVNMNVAACSCSLCDPVWAEELDVELTGLVTGNATTGGFPTCSTCPSYDGLYRLTKVPDSDSVCGSGCCAWQYDITGSCTVGATPNFIRVTITQSGANYFVRVQINIGVHGTDSALFDIAPQTPKYDCSAWNATNVPFTSQSGHYDCDFSGATVTLTAVDA